MKLISWNVNGIRSVMNKGFAQFVREEAPDLLCLQEVRASNEQANLILPNYRNFWNAPQRAGYSGTAVLVKSAGVSVKGVQNGIGVPKHDMEGRVVTLEFPDFYLVNVYVPNSKRDLSRLDYRTKEWDADFLKHLKNLEKKKPVVTCGDFNVAHTEIDLTNPQANVRNHGFTPEERASFDRFIKAGFIDTFREFIKDGGHYTWWSQMGNCRKRNIGWRIDYFLISPALRLRLKEAFILKDVMGSDHCPIGIILGPGPKGRKRDRLA